ncbi:MAG TPA: S-layer homology domain-containing protein, partial [Bacillota bacterium]
AAINGDFFYMTPDAPGAPIGILVRNGELFSSGTGAAIGVDGDGRPVTGNPGWSGRVEVLDGDGRVTAERALCGVNKPRAETCLVLYTPTWGPSTRTNEWGGEAIVVPVDGDALPLKPRSAFVAQVRVGPDRMPGGNANIPGGSVILSGHGTAHAFLRDHLREGGMVRVVLDVEDAWADVVHAIGGDPVLVVDGRRAALPNTASATRREPRTAVGLDAQGRWLWVVIDGRRPGWSEGATLLEVADILIEAGARWALNLDGGGSSTMLVRPAGEFQPELVNKPSDGRERAIGPAWVAVSRAQPGPAAHTWLSVDPPPDLPVLPGVPVAFEVRAQDRNHEPVAVDGADLELERTGAGAAPIVDRSREGGRLQVVPGGPGLIAVRAEAGGLETRAEVRVAGPADITRVDIQPDPATLRPGSEVTFTATAFDGSGRPLPATAQSFAWSGTGDFAAITDGGRIRIPEGYAEGTVTAALRSVTEDGERVDLPLRMVTLAVGEPPEPEPVPEYTDMAGHWAHDAVATLTGRRVVQGYPDGSFGPERSVTRAEFAIMLQRLLAAVSGGTISGAAMSGGAGTAAGAGINEAALPFTDADEIPEWAAQAIAQAAAAGLLGGYQDGTFRPQQPITRQEAAAILSRVPLGPGATGEPPSFTDADQIGDWALAAVEAAAVRGLVLGYPDGSFGPLREITRAEAAAILVRLLP